MAVGGRGTLVGAAVGAVVVNFLKSWFTTGALAPYWLFVLGSIFIFVTLALPKGIVGTLKEKFGGKRTPADNPKAPAPQAAE